MWRKLAELEISHRRREPGAASAASRSSAASLLTAQLAKQSPPTAK